MMAKRKKASFKMPKAKNPYRTVRAPRRQTPYNTGGNPMNSMVKTIGQTTMGVVGIGAMTTLGMGALNVMKPK
jgi:hypothetical protein